MAKDNLINAIVADLLMTNKLVMPQLKTCYNSAICSQLHIGMSHSPFNRRLQWPDEAYNIISTAGDRLLARLAGIKLKPKTILDLGSGTGAVTNKLAAHYPKAKLVACDLAHQRNLLSRQQRQKKNILPVTADMHTLPLADNSVDLVFSNLAVYWSCDLTKLWRECQRVIKPGGLLLFTSLGPDSLSELRACWAAVDNHPHINIFWDLHDIGDSLLAAGFTDPVMDAEKLTITYPDVATITDDLRNLGEINQHPERPRGLYTPNIWQQVIANYQQYLRPDHKLPVTLELTYGHAWGSKQKSSWQQQGDNGEVLVDINILQRK